MLTRIYIDNFRCLVNFEVKLENNISLLLGGNGSGKTTVFNVIEKLQKFIIGNIKVSDLFPSSDLTRWETRSIQKFELEIKGNGGIYNYSLEIEHQGDYFPSRMRHESLSFDGQPLSTFSIQIEQGKPVGQATIYNDDPTRQGAFLPFVDWSRSVVGFVYERQENKKLTWFKKRISNFFIVHINPLSMGEESRQEDTHPAWDMSNYAAWYSYLSGEQGKIFNLTIKLREIIDGFDAFRNKPIGDAKILSLSFPSLSEEPYKLSEISDGQRVLIALYTLIYCAPDEDYTLCIDEPENYLALPEIQPWLNTLFDQCSGADSHGQAILISHHPALINYLASSSGYWFERANEGIIRLQSITDQQDTGLSLAKLIELGWIYDE
ncbi:MAG: AAA family ATPase [Coleofasciculus sp. B1-GNL1-01]|uniref:AAA family ATPase n=1 Tax=Coleofasciculus sp. B1-GNL1-01 TaxID=3068484 RepID=UPI0032FEF66A